MDKQVSVKPNFQIMLDEIIEGLDKRPSLLLHSCCGPCSSYCLDYLKDYFDITVLYFNPNIFPETEYIKRFEVQKSLIDSMNKEYDDAKIKLIDVPYNHDEFLSIVSGFENEPEGGKRCEECFKLRLGKTAQIAAAHGFEYFGTTLSVSPHKNAMILNQVGKSLEEGSMAYANSEITFKSVDSKSPKNKEKWLYADFKKKEGYKKSIELSKKYNLYRQDYCGCEFAN